MAAPFTYDNLLETLGGLSAWSEQNESVHLPALPNPSHLTRLQILLEPYDYCTASPGKEIRTKLIEAFNLWLNVPEPELRAIARVVAKLHNASLLFVHSF